MNVIVLGLGHVGLVAAGAVAASGHNVYGLDKNLEHIQSLQNGVTTFYEPGLDNLLNSSQQNNNLQFYHTDHFISDEIIDAIIVTVGTPIVDNKLDLTQINHTIDWIIKHDYRNACVVMKSTVTPGVGRAITDALDKSDLKYVYSPEFLRTGQAIYDWYHPDRIVIGSDVCDDNIINTVKQLYSGITAPYIITSLINAEMIKLGNNAFIATRISFINELSRICEQTGANIDEVSTGIFTGSRNGSLVHAGVGYGGSCLDKDITDLITIGQHYGTNVELLRAVRSVNNMQNILPFEVINQIFSTDAIKNLNIAILGLSFKPNTSDMRNAPSIVLSNLLLDAGASIRVYDPCAMSNAKKYLSTDVYFANDELDAAKNCHAVILMTEWDCFAQISWDLIYDNMVRPKIIFDGRNFLAKDELKKLGFWYIAVGR